MSVVWIAGPVGYSQKREVTMSGLIVATSLRWEFVGQQSDGSFRRWNLRWDIEKRRFTANSIDIDRWEATKARQLGDLYRPASVLRSMLPKGGIVKALEAMLRPEDVAEALAFSITQG